MVATRAREARLTLRAGRPLDQAVAEALAGHHADSAWLTFEAVDVTQLAYVLPDEAPGSGQVAWYSDPINLEAGRIEGAGMIWGRRDGRGFGHCHGRWSGREDRAGAGLRMGHLLSPDTILAADAQVPALLFDDARFDAAPDAETGFTLFRPVATTMPPAAPDAALLRLAPDEDVSLSLSDAVSDLGWPAAHVHGIGSINEVRFRGGRVLPSYATEFLITHGAATPDGADIALDVVGLGGELAAGILRNGDNPVLITAELVLIKA